jgi:muramoyltetrapeptide carboxypeptidase LdcA involved in peptidoglycan recycling
MNRLIKPKKLCPGDTIAAISISAGRAGDPDMLERYYLGKRRLEEVFGLKVVETPNALKGSDFIYRNPKARVDDLMQALLDPSIKGIITNMGGDDTYRLLPYVDYDVIRNNPKIYIGFSDISSSHNIFTYAGVSSFYGASLLPTIAEPVSLDEYTIRWIKKALFSSEIIGQIEPCAKWSPLDWKSKTEAERVWTKNPGYEVFQGIGKVTGRLLGGCGGPLQQMMGTCVFPKPQMWQDSILFLEIPAPYGQLSGLHSLRAFAATGMFRNAKGMICTYMEESDKNNLAKVIRDEENLIDFPILLNVDFGHRTPMTVLPIGALAEIDCDNNSFSILESGVL